MRIHRFRILRELGVGSMGRVYLAEDPNIGRRLALKVLSPERLSRPEKQSEMHARFLAEARAAGGLTHPGIVTVYDADSDPLSGDPYLAMELVEGHSLRQILDQEAPLGMSRTLDLIAQVARALAFAHRHEVIHRDVKPANLLVRPDGVVKVVDFGIAKLVSPGLTQPGKLLGTPFYMAPEHLRSKPLDGRADLFSLGVVLYECLTGRVPFSADNIAAVQVKILQEDAPPIAHISAALHEVIDRALAKEPDDRYATGDELADDLAAIGSELPTQSLPRAHPPIGGSAQSTTELPAPPLAGAMLNATQPMDRPPSSSPAQGNGKLPPPPNNPLPPPVGPTTTPVSTPLQSTPPLLPAQATASRPAPSRPPKKNGSAYVFVGLALALVALMAISYGLARWLRGGEGGGEEVPEGRRIAMVTDFRAIPPPPSPHLTHFPMTAPPLPTAPPPRSSTAAPPTPIEPPPGETADEATIEMSQLQVVISRNRTSDPTVTIREVGEGEGEGEVYFEDEIKTRRLRRKRLEIPIFELPSGRQALLVTLDTDKGERVAQGEVVLDLEPGGPFLLHLEHAPESADLVLSEETH